MDSLSIATSIAGLLKAAAGVSSIVSKIAASKKSGFKKIKDVKTTVDTLRSVLHQLQSLLLRSGTVDHRRASMILVDEVVATLTGCVMTFSDLDGCVKGLESDDKLGLLDSARWASRAPELRKNWQNLEAHKSSLTLMLSILTWYPTSLFLLGLSPNLWESSQSSQNAENAASELKQLMLRVLDSNEDLARRMCLLESSDAVSTVGSEDDSVSHSHDTIIGPPTLAETHASGNASQHIRIVHAFEEDLQSSWVYQRSRTRGPDTFSISGTTQLTQSWSMLSGMSLSHISSIAIQALPITIEDLNNGELYNIEETDEILSEHGTIVQIQIQQPSKQSTRPYRPIGPYNFTHKELVKKGVIQKTNVPDYRQSKIWFKFQNPEPGAFVVGLFYKGV